MWTREPLCVSQIARWNRTLPLGAVERNLVFLPRADRERVLSLVAAADVALDTYPWGGGVTVLEALAVYAHAGSPQRPNTTDRKKALTERRGALSLSLSDRSRLRLSREQAVSAVSGHSRFFVSREEQGVHAASSSPERGSLPPFKNYF